MNRQLTDQYLHAKRIAMAVAEAGDGDAEQLIQRECAGDGELLREVRWMLTAMQSTHTATLPGAAEPSPDLSGLDTQGITPHKYRILRRLGEGGMGTVYLAERSDGDFVQQVALKLLTTAAQGSPILTERFCQERKLLARLEHPCIARLLDGGALADGKPFLAMEYVEGERIDLWCDRHQLDLTARIRLFLSVCAAVDYAHRRLIIHRDIKPANILVSEDGTPKLLDFGIARVLDEDAEVLVTATAQHAMTLAYASPEQIERLPLTTAADVYSLGVVLYQLVAGKRPYQHIVTPHLLSIAIMGGNVVPPSRAARTRHENVEQVAAQLRSVPKDIDAIVMKALRRSVNDRYPGVTAMSDDLKRFLDRRPVQARRGRRWYRVRRFAQRNRWPLVVGSAVVGAVLAGLVGSLMALHQTRMATQEVEQRERELQRMVTFQQSMLDSVDIQAMGHAMATAQQAQLQKILGAGAAPVSTDQEALALKAAFSQLDSTDIARNVLDTYVVTHALDSLGKDFVDAPTLAADVRQSLASVLVNIGSYGHAVTELKQVLAARLENAPQHAGTILLTQLALADALYRDGDLDAAARLYERTSKNTASRPLADPLHFAAESGRARVLFAQGHMEQARKLQQSLYDRLRQQLPATDPGLIRLRSDLVITLIGLGKRDEALAQAEPLVALNEATLGPNAPQTLQSMITLAKLQHYRHNFEKALATAQQVAVVRQERLGADHPDTLEAIHLVATEQVYLAQNEAAFRKADATLDHLVSTRERVLGEDHPDTIASQTLRVRLLSKEGNASSDPVVTHRYMSKAIALERWILAAHQRQLGDDRPATLMAHGSLANLLSYDSQYPEALSEANLTLAGQQRVLGADHPIVFATYGLLGDIEVASGHWAAARKPYEKALAGRERVLGVGDALTIETASRLYEVLRNVRDDTAAVKVRTHYLDPVIAMDPSTLNASMLDVRRSAVEQVQASLIQVAMKATP
jgi:serine/threonine protein kinase/tetratricopeptide (TPR) repeat protein